MPVHPHFGVRIARAFYGPRDERLGTTFGTHPMTYLTQDMALAVARRYGQGDDAYAWIVPLDREGCEDIAARVRALEENLGDLPW